MKVFATATLLLLAFAGARAEQVTCAADAITNPNLGVNVLCAGVNEAAVDAEIDTSVFEQVVEDADNMPLNLNTGATGQADVTFTIGHDGGAFLYTFGFCLTSGIDADVLAGVTDLSGDDATDDAARLAFAKACIGNDGVTTFQIFDDVADDEGATETINTALPADVVFWLLPNNRLSAFTGDAADALWANDAFVSPGSSTKDETQRRPLFSMPTANRASSDHFILYSSTTEMGTLFIWEDQEREHPSSAVGTDNDFGDLAFLVDAVIEAMPEPTPVTDGAFFCDASVGPDERTCTEATVASESNTVTLSWGNNDDATTCA